MSEKHYGKYCLKQLQYVIMLKLKYIKSNLKHKQRKIEMVFIEQELNLSVACRPVEFRDP